MTPRDAIRNAAAALEARGVPDSLYDAAQLLSFLTGKNALLLRLDTDTELTEETLAAFHDLCARRAQREPLQYILGSVFFLAHEFHADARALIPRPETELLAERVIALVTDGSLRSVLDLCCGTGCIGISIALACPDCVVTLSDLSHDALSLAQENAAALGASVQFLEGDLFTPTGAAAYDLIVSNPPYIYATVNQNCIFQFSLSNVSECISPSQFHSAISIIKASSLKNSENSLTIFFKYSLSD